jgi:cobalt-zinc-cadmium efflux system membrane fusion protein
MAGHGDTPATPVTGLPARSQYLILAVAAVVVVAGAVVGVPFFQRMTQEKAVPEAPPAVANGAFHPTPNQWANLKIEPIKTIPFRAVQDTDGKIATDDDLTTPVFSPFTGRVVKLFAKTGDTVAAGAPLLTVESTEFVQAQNDLVTAVAALSTARAQLRLAQTNERRQQALFAANAGAQKDWQQSQVDLATAQGSQNSAEIALGAVRNRLRILGRTEKEIADLEQGKDGLRFNPSSTLVAPIAGTITQRQVGLGQYIVNQSNGGTNPIFSIGDTSRVWLVANVRESDASFVHVGDPVEVRVPAYPDRVFKATLVYVASSIDPTTHRLPVRAEIDNRDGALKPEMFAQFDIVTGKASDGLAIPDRAVVYDGSTARVFIADTNAKTITSHEITIGRTNGHDVEAVSGVKPGESVVTSGALFIDRALQDD